MFVIDAKECPARCTQFRLRKWLLAAAAITVSDLADTSVQGGTLIEGVNSFSGTTVDAEPQLAGTVVVDEINAFSASIGNGIYTGSVESRVVHSIDGTYDFCWRIFETGFSGSDGSQLVAFRLADFGNLIGDNGDYRIDGSGAIGPDTAYASGGTVSFFFSAGLPAGLASKFFFLDTSATNYTKTAIFDVGGLNGFSEAFATYAPSALPEPGSWTMMIVGLGLVGTFLRKRAVTLGQWDPRLRGQGRDLKHS